MNESIFGRVRIRHLRFIKFSTQFLRTVHLLNEKYCCKLYLNSINGFLIIFVHENLYSQLYNYYKERFTEIRKVQISYFEKIICKSCLKWAYVNTCLRKSLKQDQILLLWCPFKNKCSSWVSKEMRKVKLKITDPKLFEKPIMLKVLANRLI